MLVRWKGELLEGREKNSFREVFFFFFSSSSVILNCHSQDKQTKNRFGASSRWIWVGRTFPAFIQNRTRMHSPSWVHIRARTLFHAHPHARRALRGRLKPGSHPPSEHVFPSALVGREKHVENSPSEETWKECVRCWSTPRLAVRFGIWRHFCFMAESKVASVKLAERRALVPHPQPPSTSGLVCSATVPPLRRVSTVLEKIRRRLQREGTKTGRKKKKKGKENDRTWLQRSGRRVENCQGAPQGRTGRGTLAS